eukprot:CAMPEP_0170956080 /NCGR_PEP_ID=MMETSP0735-20130129/33680_1 /TAXON_ID=186038 /ORGANISM="Fragilariopsis kerguelensis, Strain L26-C5" /LENGTH=153 /DNA_ID=CAMNT_0011368311 /DNA_START=33 /DNA_END=495 /DNA_ORIENTATION=-
MVSSKHSTPSDPSESTHLELSNGGNTTTTTTSSKTTQIKKTRPIIHLVLALSLSIFFVVIAVAGKNGRQRLKSSYYQTDSANSVVELDIFGMQNFPGNDGGAAEGMLLTSNATSSAAATTADTTAMAPLVASVALTLHFSSMNNYALIFLYLL